MTIFSSTRPRNADPEPYRAGETRYDAMAGQLLGIKKDPRPEFDVPRAHDANPILLAFRGRLKYQSDVKRPVTPGRLAQIWLKDVGHYSGETTADPLRHARKVLERLAALS